MHSSLLHIQAAKSSSVPQQSWQSEKSETAASGPDSEARGDESAYQISAAAVASNSPSDSDGAQPPIAHPASAKQDRQGAAQALTASPASTKQDRHVGAASEAAETAEVVAQPMEQHAVATTSDQQPTASTTASMHIEQSGVSRPDVPGTLFKAP